MFVQVTTNTRIQIFRVVYRDKWNNMGRLNRGYIVEATPEQALIFATVMDRSYQDFEEQKVIDPEVLDPAFSTENYNRSILEGEPVSHLNYYFLSESPFTKVIEIVDGHNEDFSGILPSFDQY